MRNNALLPQFYRVSTRITGIRSIFVIKYNIAAINLSVPSTPFYPDVFEKSNRYLEKKKKTDLLVIIYSVRTYILLLFAERVFCPRDRFVHRVRRAVN